jgi:beta-lactamase regulating signal transducer with metallopeptidase domain
MVVGVWLAGIVVVLLRWIVGWVRISLMVRKAASVSEGPEADALRRLQSSLGVRTPIRLVLFPDWMEPGIFGICRPVLIWPEGIYQYLDDKHIEAILAHEVCHARRHDNLTAVLHMSVEAIFWFHPLVWWVGAKLEEERERSCDEEVSLLCNQPHVYAESILRVCKFCSESALACVSRITGADLKKRIVQIMTGRGARKLDLRRKLLLLAVGLAVVGVPLVLGQVKAAQRMMLAAVNAAPKPIRTVAHAMITEEQTPWTRLIAEGDPRPAAQPPLAAPDSMGLGFDVSTVKPAAPNARSSALNLGNDDIKSTNLPVLFLLQSRTG